MLENYLIVALIIIVLWLVGFGVYLAVSNRQRDLEDDLNRVTMMLEEDEEAA